jgi:hypothetical protein
VTNIRKVVDNAVDNFGEVDHPIKELIYHALNEYHKEVTKVGVPSGICGGPGGGGGYCAGLAPYGGSSGFIEYNLDNIKPTDDYRLNMFKDVCLHSKEKAQVVNTTSLYEVFYRWGSELATSGTGKTFGEASENFKEAIIAQYKEWNI